MEKYPTFKTLTFVALTVISLVACTKQTAVMPAPMAVVESYLTPGKPAAVRITREIVYGSADTLMPLSGLHVQISHGGRVEAMTETSPGNYELSAANIIAGDTYSLSFQYQGKEISAETKVPLNQ